MSITIFLQLLLVATIIYLYCIRSYVVKKIHQFKDMIKSINESLRKGEWRSLDKHATRSIEKRLLINDFKELDEVLEETKMLMIETVYKTMYKDEKEFHKKLEDNLKENLDKLAQIYKEFFPDLKEQVTFKDRIINISSFIHTIDFGAGDGVIYVRYKNKLIFFVFDMDGHGGPSSYAAHQLFIMTKSFFYKKEFKEIKDLVEHIMKHSYLLGDHVAESFFMCIDLETEIIETMFLGDCLVVGIHEDGCHYDLRKIDTDSGNVLGNIRHDSHKEIEIMRKIKTQKYFINEFKAIIVMTDGYYNSYSEGNQTPIDKEPLADIMHWLFEEDNFPENINPYFRKLLGENPIPKDDRTYLTITFHGEGEGGQENE